MAGCPKCAVDLVLANPHKKTRRMPNGFLTFEDLREGETINLPDKWFDGTLDRMPKIYFTALPYPDGVTSSSLGDAAAGVVAGYSGLDAASVQVGALAVKGDQEFHATLDGVGDQILAAIQETVGHKYAGVFANNAAHGVEQARSRNADLGDAITAGNQTAAFQARIAALQALSSALGDARLALGAFYGESDTPTPPVPAVFPTNVVEAAHMVVEAVSADPNYCAAVSHTGTLVNAAVHAFKLAWNTSQVGASLPINTGNYEQATAVALASVLGSAPAACSATPKPPVSLPAPAPDQVAQTPNQGISTGKILGIGALAAGAVGGAIYLSKQPRRRRRS